MGALNNTFGIVTIALVFGVGAFIGHWWNRPTIDDLVERNNRYAAMDTVREIKYGNLRSAFEKIVYDFANERSAREFIEDSLSEQNGQLLAMLREKSRRLESLATANVSLQDRLDTALGQIRVTNDSVTAEIHARKDYNDGSISADGTVRVQLDPPQGEADLSFDARLSPTLAISRDENGLAQCDISFGDVPVDVYDLECVSNLDRDLPVRKGIEIPSMALGGAIVAGIVVVLLAAF